MRALLALGLAVAVAAPFGKAVAQDHGAEHVPQAPAETPPPEAARPDVPSWPAPVLDDESFSLWRFDLLELTRVGEVATLRWDFVGWHGTDRQRLWLKTGGELYEGGGGEYDLQVLHGKRITAFFDVQAGLRVEQHQERKAAPRRAFVVGGIAGLAPYRIDVDASLLLSDRGQVALRATASHDSYMTQRWILQSRIEAEAWADGDEEFGVEPGLTDATAGLRLRREIRRETALYVGVSYRTALGATRARVRREGGDTEEVQALVGLRAWF